MPEISPELAARIESLRASHAENPARFFMPLASAYREGGDVARAEELLRENLKRHPGYLSAHVLLGRCLADRGAHAEARNEFQYVLSVDSQNLIALRSLGDMAAAGGDPAEARRWYGELLAVDPMNTEAKNAVAGLDAAPAAPAEGSEAGGFGMVEPEQAQGPAADHPAAHADPGTWGEVSLDDHPAFSAGSEPAAGEPAPASFDALEFGAVDLSGAPAHEEPAHDEPAAPSAGAFEPVAQAPGDAWGALDDGQDAVDGGGVEPLELEEFYGASDAAPAAHADEHEEHEEVVTETIAELYARQGFPERAAGVYRELIARRGDEPALVRRLAELEAQLAAAPAGDAGAFAPLDLAGEADDSADWLRTVDSVVAGEASAPAAAPEETGLVDLEPVDFQPAEPSPAAAEPEDAAPLDLGMVDFEPASTSGFDEPPAAPPEDSVAAASSVAGSTGDAFADSFANGFDGSAAEAPRAEWEAPRVEETAPVPELESAAAASAGSAVEPMEMTADATESTGLAEIPSAAPEPGRVETIVAYLSSLLAWRPGAPAPAAQPDAAAPPPARPWDEETLGASDEQPPIDEPWIAGDVPAEPASAEPPAAEPSAEAGTADEAEPWTLPSVDAEPEPWSAETPAESESWSAETPAAETPAEPEPWAAEAPAAEPSAEPEPEPWASEATPAEPSVEPEPWAEATEPEPEDAGGDLPWLSSDVEAAEAPAGAEPAAEAEDAPMPWETSFELSPEVPEDTPTERQAPRQEPTAGPAGGFSFEDFFSEPVAPPAPAAAPEPEPLPEPLPSPAEPASAAAPEQAPPAGEEDEDLESFQAWLQSLKR